MSNVRTIFYQGMTCSQTQAAKYIAGEFTSTTGDKIRCKKAMDGLINYYPGPEITEIEPMLNNKKHDTWSAFFSYYLYKKFFHLESMYSNWYHSTEVLCLDTEKEHTIVGHHVDITQMSFGQENDMKNHKMKYDDLLENHPDTDIVLWGVSRGAATTFNSMCHNNYDTSKVKLVILEGCYDNMENVINETYTFPLNKVMLSSLTSFTQHSLEGISPLNSASKFPKDVPVAFITSKNDETVPFNRTMEVVNALKKSGHKKIHLLILKNSSHANYVHDCSNDREKYHSFIHGLYKLYNLPYKENHVENIDEKLVGPL